MKTTLAIGITTILLATIAGAALAQGPGGDAADDRRERVQALREARNESLQQFHENRTAAMEEFRAAHNETKRSFLENKTRVIDECNAARNETAEDNNSEYAKCVSDGLRPLIQQARAEHKAQRDAFHERMIEARQAAIEHFRAARASMRAADGS